MKTVYVVTHPEATHHTAHLVGGWYDSDLTDRGLTHARAIAEALAAGLPESAGVEVRSSDLRRTRRTAEIIARHLGTEVLIDPDLRERSFGEAGGKPQAWLDERLVPPPATGDRLRHDDGIPGAETKWALAVRAYSAMERVQQSEADHIVVVSHGGTSIFLLAAWIGMPIDASGLVSFRLNPGGISVLVEDDRYHHHQISSLNDVSHLSLL